MFSCLSRVVVLSLFTVSLWAHEGVWSISPGVLGASGIDASFVANAALFIAMLILWVVCIAQLLKLLFNLPIIAGQIIAGLLLGPSCINIARWPLFFTPLRLFDEQIQQQARLFHQMYRIAIRLKIMKGVPQLRYRR